MAAILSILSGISFASGLNVYATVLALGLLDRFSVVQLPSPLNVVSTTPVLAGAFLMYAVEFVADKIPYVDSVWDTIHTVIRPVAGSVLAYSAVGDVASEWQVLAALAGGSLALTAHTAKASTRAAANVSPEPFSNWILSLVEDAIAFGLVWISATHPFLALSVLAVLVAIAVLIIVKLSRLVRRVFSPRTDQRRRPYGLAK
jgi:hypothetical protein